MIVVGLTKGRVAGVDIQREARKSVTNIHIVCTVSGRKTTASYSVPPVQGFRA
jgi:hypothetical protein